MACGVCLHRPFCIDFGNFARHSDRTRCVFCVTANRVIDFLAVDRHIARGIYSDSNFITPDFNDGDADVITDDDRFVALP